MATQAGGFIRDQNLNVHFDVAPVLKTNNKLQKNGGFGGRKALGDISNSRRPSTNLPPNKLNSKKAIPVAEDFAPSISKSSIGVKNTKLSSTKGSGRKALGDLTNSITPHVAQGSKKKALDKKLSAVVEEPLLFDSEGIDEYFLHDHEECIKAQKKANAMDLEYFLKDYGVGNSMQSSPPWVPHSSAKMKPESPVEFSDLEELFGESKDSRDEMLGEEYICESPISLPRYHGDVIFSLTSSP